MPNWAALLGPLAAGSAAGFVSMKEYRSPWYVTLKKPSWQPPAKLFGPVWTVLYLLMGAALAIALSAGLSASGQSWFALQMVLNIAWTFTFFNMKNLDLALADILGLVVAILGTMATFAAVSPLAAWLLLPYLAWVLFATALTASIRSKNCTGCPVAEYFKNADKVVAIASMMRRPTDISTWLDVHRKMGIGRFYVRAEDSPDLVAFLKTQADVVLEEGDSDGGNNYNTQQSRQTEFVNRALDKAMASGDVAWLLHIDADELLDGDLSILATLPASIKCLRIQNAEAIFGKDDKTCFSTKKFIKCSSGPCLSYANGKAGGRVEEGVRANGAHFFTYRGAEQGEHTKDFAFEELKVLHFDSCSIGAWLEKFSHLLKGADDKAIPFPFYKDSMKAAQHAAEVYRNHKVDREVDSAHIYTKSS